MNVTYILKILFKRLTDAWAWQHFPLAIEGPRELWRTLAGYSKDTSDEYVFQNYQCETVYLIVGLKFG